MKPATFQLYLREGCHLCEEMQLAIEMAGAELKIELIDVDSDPALVRRYGEIVPVLAIGETVVCWYTFDRQALERTLATMAGAVPPDS